LNQPSPVRQRGSIRGSQPLLRFSPTAWSKLLFFRDRGETEIGGFGISASDDLLYIEDLVLVKQDVTVASVAFDDEAVADHFETQVVAGRKPEQFARVWAHTHPGESAEPSVTDEETFHRVFGRCDWAVMFILSRTGKMSARLRFNVGPGGEVKIPVQVDFSLPFASSQHETWQAEYEANVRPGAGLTFIDGLDAFDEEMGFDKLGDPEDWLESFETLTPSERRLVLDELAARPDLWEESEVLSEY